ncbi:MAG TPA: IPT/TIG domain-containing protein, partial [Thermoanaerobaculia bacterium]|nr:IPT/TIG domain-containing protein [Thermoanaerobaculia bacterium]
VLPWSHTAEIGALAPGAWTLQATVNDRAAAATSLTVADAEARFVVVPSSSRAEGGTTVRLRGARIAECGDACQHLRVSFGGVDASSVRVINGSELEVSVPPHAAGRVDVVVYYATTGVQIAAPSAFLYYDWAEGPPSEAFERILIPLMFDGEGAFASRWTTELTVRNHGDAGIDPWNSILRCGAAERCHPQISAGATLHLTPSSLGIWMHGLLFVVPREQAGDLDFQLRIHDLSRRKESFGTEIPVVREAELPRSPVTLLDVPLDEGFRRMLRIYDVSAIDGARVAMRWRLDDGTQVGKDQQLVLGTLIRCVTTPCWFPEPAGLAVPLFDASLPPSITQDHLHVELEPLTPGSRIWAFVTVTNNETQQVTTITPQ